METIFSFDLGQPIIAPVSEREDLVLPVQVVVFFEAPCGPKGHDVCAGNRPRHHEPLDVVAAQRLQGIALLLCLNSVGRCVEALRRVYRRLHYGMMRFFARRSRVVVNIEHPIPAKFPTR